MSVDSNKEVMILFLPWYKQIFPLAPIALTEAAGSRRRLKEGNEGALVMKQDGTLRRIERIEILGPTGKSAWLRFLSRCLASWRINVVLSDPLPCPLEQAKWFFVHDAHFWVQDKFESLDVPWTVEAFDQACKEFVASVRAVTNMEELLNLLDLPAPEDCLDVL